MLASNVETQWTFDHEAGGRYERDPFARVVGGSLLTSFRAYIYTCDQVSTA